MSEAGEIEGEGLIPADEDGFARLVLKLGTEVKGPAKSSVAHKLLITSWHMLSRGQVVQPPRSTTAAESRSRFLAA